MLSNSLLADCPRPPFSFLLRRETFSRPCEISPGVLSSTAFCTFLTIRSTLNCTSQTPLRATLLRCRSTALTSAVPPSTRRVLDDTHEIYDPSTITNPPRHRQQQPALEPAPSSSIHPRPSSASGSLRHLRRVSPRVDISNPQAPTHRRTTSVDETPRRHRTRGHNRPISNPRAAGRSFADIAPALSEAETEAGASTSQDSVQQLGDTYWPSRSTRVSPRTGSAILWALEEAIRKPFPFSPYLEELNASMSELIGPAVPVAAGRPPNGGPRPAQGPRHGHTQVPAGVRTPTDIMRDRRDREARKKAEKEAREREQEAELLRQRQEQERLQQTQGPPYPAATAPAGPVSGNPPTQATRQQPSEQPQARLPGAPGNGNLRSAPPAQQQPVPPASQPTQNPTQAPQSQEQPRRATFPHAFERWETLSSHWEGLTGYWIRKLEQNNSELSEDPLNQQMARQINDLSAAGANLFHAVVELQRLRASSERKFQRWFFDTRAEQEKSREVQADLERQLQVLKLERSDAGELRQKAESERKKAEEMVREMRRELQISKEEARRAWEELGRREQEERDRTTSLRNGEPTHVGGVQVVPMITGAPSRQNSSANRPQTREGPYPGGPTATGMGGQPQGQAAYAEDDLPEKDPFVETPRAAGYPSSTHAPDPATFTGGTPKSQPPVTSAAYADAPGHFYQHGGTVLHEEADDRSYVASTEGSELDAEYATHGGAEYHDRVQSQEYAGSDEYDDDSQQEYDPTYPPTSGGPAPVHHTYGQGNVDYSGSGWGGWDSITPRHRHPTRLSDVLEEDERSRTSPSRASQASRGLH
ncbi:hypothetical protein PISL3812_00151 [Talaromyces islandicus]|uniref:Reticulocyte-binding protein 2 homolog a n=1 Tax=Talaromyces islandicus TaxID=28573 RepID=A0A0U1LII2_TALIS|nr:hypothetical protein PISL3812_00151 [Talaromyces islandicus]